MYLPEGCGEADFSGLYGVNLISQREGTYAKGQDCILHLRVPTGYFFNITFTHFDLEPPTQDGSCSDYLQLYNGHGTEMLLSEHLCGSKVPSSILSNTSEVTLRFHSDKQKEFTGFKLIYDRIEAKTLKELGLLDTAQQKVLSQNLRDDAVNSKSSSGHLKEGREGQQGSSLHVRFFFGHNTKLTKILALKYSLRPVPSQSLATFHLLMSVISFITFTN